MTHSAAHDGELAASTGAGTGTLVRPALRVEELRAGYGESDVLHGVSFAIQPGEISAILGKNGMGKTTLLKTMMGFLPTRSGRVEILGHDVTGWPTYRIARHGVSYVPQEKSMFQDLSVEENLRLALGNAPDFWDRLDALAQGFPLLKERLRQRAGTLSGGEQKMLLIARALMVRPRVVLVDEVSEGLQPAVIVRFKEVLADERRRNRLTIVLVEQNVDFALALADHYAVLKLGTIVERGRVGDVGARQSVEQHLTI